MFWWFRVVMLPLKRVIMGDSSTGFRVQGIIEGLRGFWKAFGVI